MAPKRAKKTAQAPEPALSQTTSVSEDQAAGQPKRKKPKTSSNKAAASQETSAPTPPQSLPSADSFSSIITLHGHAGLGIAIEQQEGNQNRSQDLVQVGKELVENRLRTERLLSFKARTIVKEAITDVAASLGPRRELSEVGVRRIEDLVVVLKRLKRGVGQLDGQPSTPGSQAGSQQEQEQIAEGQQETTTVEEEGSIDTPRQYVQEYFSPQDPPPVSFLQNEPQHDPRQDPTRRSSLLNAPVYGQQWVTNTGDQELFLAGAYPPQPQTQNRPVPANYAYVTRAPSNASHPTRPETPTFARPPFVVVPMVEGNPGKPEGRYEEPRLPLTQQKLKRPVETAESYFPDSHVVQPESSASPAPPIAALENEDQPAAMPEEPIPAPVPVPLAAARDPMFGGGGLQVSPPNVWPQMQQQEFVEEEEEEEDRAFFENPLDNVPQEFLPFTSASFGFSPSYPTDVTQQMSIELLLASLFQPGQTPFIQQETLLQGQLNNPQFQMDINSLLNEAQPTTVAPQMIAPRASGGMTRVQQLQNPYQFQLQSTVGPAIHPHQQHQQYFYQTQLGQFATHTPLYPPHAPPPTPNELPRTPTEANGTLLEQEGTD